jgi:glycosyltransferase involved in cell wall biosynthesis
MWESVTVFVAQVVGNVAIGGAEQHLLDLTSGLVQRGINVATVCPRPGPLSEALVTRGVAVSYIEMVYPRPGDEYAVDPSAVHALTGWLRRRQPDVVHSHLYPAHLHATLAARDAGVATVVQTAHTLIVRQGDVVLGRLTSAHTIAVSAAVARLHATAGVPADRISVIYNGVGAEHLAEPEQPPDHLRAELGLPAGSLIGTVSRLSPEKGLDNLLRAIARLADKGMASTLLIAGEGPEAEPLRRLAGELGIAERVRFLGARNDVPRLNRLVDLFVLPSREEACPLALLEAMAGRRAVVSTRVGGSPELVTDGVDGLLVANGLLFGAAV